jgi:DNA modification methylase
VTINNAETKETSHRGRKPAGLLSYLIRIFTDEGDYVVDPFLGSGTTLYVSQELKRACIGGEIDPEFCGLIIDRWQNKTGLKAEKIN